ncbi:PH domain-containing protein [Herbiconiux solani]|uniref:PH domain-containing protein n=1 Tax=Herbiconiux solani TaxID=661329 RepID=UPI000A0372F8|nr:PH domain-containing protein [Herbiconiux solani]
MARRNDETERFGWGAPGTPGGPAASGAPASGAPAFDDLLGGTPQPYGFAGHTDYTTNVERVRDAAPERILLRVRPHARRLVLPVLVLFATVTAFGWFGGRFAEEWQNWLALGVAAALLFFCTLVPFFAWLGHRYTITDRRIIARSGFLVRHRQDLYLARVTDVRLRRGPLQAMAGSGDVRVVAGPDLTLVLRDVPSARLVAALLGELTEHPTPATPHYGAGRLVP